MVREIGQETKVAFRNLRRAPGFALAAVLVLALGIGANVAIYSAVQATLLTPPPYPQPERLVLLDLTDASTEVAEPPRPFPWSYPKYRLLAERQDLLADPVAAYAVRPLTLTGAGDATRIPSEVVTPDYLEVLGVVPVLGRDLAAADDRPEAEPVALLGHALWHERFGGDPGVVGRAVTLNGRPVTVAGIAPAGFRGLSGDADLFVPVHTGAALIAPFLVTGGQAHWLQALGRLRPEATLEALSAQMATVGQAAQEAFPETDPTLIRSAAARSLADARIHPQARRSLLVVSAAAMLLLLVACANLAGLFLARGSARTRETAVRIALGAGRFRAARGMLAESLLLAAAGGALALLVARAGIDLLASAWPERFVYAGWNLRFADPAAIDLDGGALAFAAGLALLTGLASGVLPAVSAARRDPGRDLRQGASGALGGGRRRGSLRSVLVAGEVAVTLVLVVGAGLMLRSLAELQAVERGVDPEGLLIFEYSLPRTSRWAENPAAFHQAYLERLKALPEVRSVGLGCSPPLGGHCMITLVRQAGGNLFAEGARPPIGVDSVDPGFFDTLGIPVLQGRGLREQDRRGAPPVIVLNETAARRLFPGGDALGRTIALGIDLTPEGSDGAEVVGIVGDVLYDRPEIGVMPEAYVSMYQEEAGGRVFLRARGEPMALVAPARALLAQLDPDVPLFGAMTLADVEAQATADTRSLGGLLGAFAALALLLAATGVWAVVAHGVAARTRELGLRMALGAVPRSVVALVVRQGVVPAVAGVAAGAALAWAGGRALQGLLYEVSPTDPWTVVGAAAFLLAVSVLAAWLPARRATEVDPMEALRAE